MLESVNRLSALVGANHATVQRRADQLGLKAKSGEKGAKLYDSRMLLQLVPLPVKAESGDEAITLEEARIRQTNADAELKELAIQKEKGVLADVRELLELQNELFDRLAAGVKNSGLSEAEKDDLLSLFVSVAEDWANG